MNASSASVGAPLAPAERARLVKSATWASLAVALLLVLLKLWAWLATDSVALLASLADSLLDVLSSALTFWAVRFSLSPADADHRFGHGKSEGLAALLQSLIIGGSGIFVCTEALQRFVSPATVERPTLGIGVAFLSIAATIGLVSYQRYVRKRTGSIAIAADAMHYRSDLIVNLAVAGAIGATAVSGWILLDPLVGLMVGLYILRGAWQIAQESLDILLDREIPESDRARIEAIAASHSDVRGIHDMRTRHGGAHYIVQFHLELDPEITLLRSHVILDEVEDAVRREYPGCEIIIHADPRGFAERRDEFHEPPLRISGNRTSKR